MGFNFAGLGFIFGARDDGVSRVADNASKSFGLLESAFSKLEAIAGASKFNTIINSWSVSKLSEISEKISGIGDGMAGLSLTTGLEQQAIQMNKEFSKTAANMNLTSKEAAMWGKRIKSAVVDLNIDAGKATGLFKALKDGSKDLTKAYGDSYEQVLKTFDVLDLDPKEIGSFGKQMIRDFNAAGKDGVKEFRKFMDQMTATGKRAGDVSATLKMMPDLYAKIDEAQRAIPERFRMDPSQAIKGVGALATMIKKNLGKGMSEATASASKVVEGMLGMQDQWRGLVTDGTDLSEEMKTIASHTGSLDSLFLKLSQSPVDFVKYIGELEKKGGNFSPIAMKLRESLISTVGPDIHKLLERMSGELGGLGSTIEALGGSSVTAAGDVKGAFQEIGKIGHKTGRTFEERMQRMEESHKIAMREIGGLDANKLIARQRKAFKMIQDVAGTLASGDGPIAGMTKAMIKLRIAGFSGLMSAIGPAAGALGEFADSAFQVIQKNAQFITALTNMGFNFNMLGKVISPLGAPFDVFNSMLGGMPGRLLKIVGPAGLVVGGIGLIGKAISSAGKEGTSKAKEMFGTKMPNELLKFAKKFGPQWVKDIANSIGLAGDGPWKKVGMIVAEGLKRAWSFAVDTFKTGVDLIGRMFDWVVKQLDQVNWIKFADKVSGSIIRAIDWSFDRIGIFLSDAWDALFGDKKAEKKAETAGSRVASKMFAAISTILTRSIDKISERIGQVDWGEVFGKIGKGIVKATKWLSNLIMKLFSGLWDGLFGSSEKKKVEAGAESMKDPMEKGLSKAVGGLGRALAKAVKDGLARLWDKIGQWWNDDSKSFGDKVGDAAKVIGGAFAFGLLASPRKLFNFLPLLMGGIGKLGSIAFGIFKTIGLKGTLAVGLIIQAFRVLPGVASEVMAAIENPIMSTGDKALSVSQSVFSGILQMVGVSAETAKGLWESMVDVMSNTITKFMGYASIVWSGIKLSFKESIVGIKEVWFKLTSKLNIGWLKFKHMFIDAIAGIKLVFTKMVWSLSDAFTFLIDKVRYGILKFVSSLPSFTPKLDVIKKSLGLDKMESEMKRTGRTLEQVWDDGIKKRDKATEKSRREEVKRQASSSDEALANIMKAKEQEKIVLNSFDKERKSARKQYAKQVLRDRRMISEADKGIPGRTEIRKSKDTEKAKAKIKVDIQKKFQNDIEKISKPKPKPKPSKPRSDKPMASGFGGGGGFGGGAAPGRPSGDTKAKIEPPTRKDFEQVTMALNSGIPEEYTITVAPGIKMPKSELDKFNDSVAKHGWDAGEKIEDRVGAFFKSMTGYSTAAKIEMLKGMEVGGENWFKEMLAGSGIKGASRDEMNEMAKGLQKMVRFDMEFGPVQKVVGRIKEDFGISAKSINETTALMSRVGPLTKEEMKRVDQFRVAVTKTSEALGFDKKQTEALLGKMRKIRISPDEDDLKKTKKLIETKLGKDEISISPGVKMKKKEFDDISKMLERKKIVAPVSTEIVEKPKKTIAEKPAKIKVKKDVTKPEQLKALWKPKKVIMKKPVRVKADREIVKPEQPKVIDALVPEQKIIPGAMVVSKETGIRTSEDYVASKPADLTVQRFVNGKGADEQDVTMGERGSIPSSVSDQISALANQVSMLRSAIMIIAKQPIVIKGKFDKFMDAARADSGEFSDFGGFT
jgi:hypothetical protein